MSMLAERARHRARPADLRAPSPVFVDGSGRRGTWVARGLIGVAALGALCLLAVAVGLLGGPVPGGLLPWARSAPTARAVRAPHPAATSAAHPAHPARPGAAPVPGARRPGPAVPPPQAQPPGTPTPTPTASPAPSASASSPATAAARRSRGHSAEAPGHVKHQVPAPTPTSHPDAVPVGAPASGP